MTDINLLKSKMAAQGYSNFTTDLMTLLNISWTSASQKMNDKSNFSQSEIKILTSKLHLTGDDVKQIFVTSEGG